jgi:hypothetical protein
MKFYPTLIFIGLICLVFSSCSLPDNSRLGNNPSVVFTAAAHTVEAQLTDGAFLNQTSLPATSIPPTNLPTAETAFPEGTDTPSQLPIVTPGPTQPCDAARFVSDISIPDGTKLITQESFIKTWQFTNMGSCTWNSSYTLVFDAGDLMGGPASLPIPDDVAPGQQVNISVPLQAPSTPGSYRGYWRLRNPSGVMLPVANGYNGKSFYVDIQVKSGGKKFTVTNVVFNVSRSGTCSLGVYTVTAKVVTNAAGKVSYIWRRSDGISGPLSNGALTFSAAGSQTISYDWPSGATGLSMTLYIDDPNHQEFGTALLNCP